MKLDRIWRWKERRPRLFEVAVSIAIGLVVEIVLAISQPPALTIVRKTADEVADRMIRLSDRIGAAPSPSPGYALFDIDDATWSAWGRRVVTPRDQIAQLITRAAAAAPLAILVDIDLSYRDDPRAESKLFAVLEHYPSDAPPLILVRALNHAAGDPPPPPEQRATPFDAAVEGKANIMFAAPLFERDSDGQVRRWRLFAQTCSGDRPAVLPASQVAAAVLAREAIAHRVKPAPAPAVWQELATHLAAFSADNCRTERPVGRGLIAEETQFARQIAVERTDASTRVLYRIGWRADAPALGRRKNPGGGETALVSVRPAHLVATAPPGAGAAWAAGRIAIIGGSFVDSGDWHQTPLGRMPGALVLVNAIEALTVNGTPEEPGFLLSATISLAIIIVAAVAAAWVRPVIAGGITAVFVFIVMLAFLRSFQSGVVIDLAVPAVGAAIHDFSAAVIRTVQDLRREGFKWLFKKPEQKTATAESGEAGSSASELKAAGVGGSSNPPSADGHSA